MYQFQNELLNILIIIKEGCTCGAEGKRELALVTNGLPAAAGKKQAVVMPHRDFGMKIWKFNLESQISNLISLCHHLYYRTMAKHSIVFTGRISFFWIIQLSNQKRTPMCLTAAQFYALHEMQQMRLLVQSSVILGERRTCGFVYVLYNINGLYVEEARSLHDESLHYYACIEDTDLLLPYTEEIEIVFV